MPGGTAGERVLFEEDDVLPTEPGEMVSDAGADHAAADNNDFGFGGKGHGHLLSFGVVDRVLPKRILTPALSLYKRERENERVSRRKIVDQ